MLKSLGYLIIATLLSLATPPAQAEEIIVFLRHGEKPPLGLGQLSCQGLNRALSLPPVLQAKFGKPTALYAPDPGSMAKDKGVDYNYLRPLATIEPSAIRWEMPVNTSFGLTQVEPLEKELLKPEFRAATILVAWEHNLARHAARDLVATLGGPALSVPVWDDHDFDSLYVVRVNWLAEKPAFAGFEVQREGLDHQPTDCPGPKQ